MIHTGSGPIAALVNSGFVNPAPARHQAISSPTIPTTTNQTRRTMLRQLAAAAGGAALGTALLTLPGGKEAQARTVINPKGCKRPGR